MYDTKTRIALVKKRMHEYHRRQERRTVCRLSVLCTLLFLSLVGAMGIMQSQPINVTGMYGTILLHEDAGGYVLVAVISFTVAFIGLLCTIPIAPTRDMNIRVHRTDRRQTVRRSWRRWYSCIRFFTNSIRFSVSYMPSILLSQKQV